MTTPCTTSPRNSSMPIPRSAPTPAPPCSAPPRPPLPRPPPPAGAPPGAAPPAYPPPYLAEQTLTSCSALASERTQVTMLFADLKDSTELIRGFDPEAAQPLLDPALHLMMDVV